MRNRGLDRIGEDGDEDALEPTVFQRLFNLLIEEILGVSPLEASETQVSMDEFLVSLMLFRDAVEEE